MVYLSWSAESAACCCRPGCAARAPTHTRCGVCSSWLPARSGFRRPARGRGRAAASRNRAGAARRRVARARRRRSSRHRRGQLRDDLSGFTVSPSRTRRSRILPPTRKRQRRRIARLDLAGQGGLREPVVGLGRHGDDRPRHRAGGASLTTKAKRPMQSQRRAAPDGASSQAWKVEQFRNTSRRGKAIEGRANASQTQYGLDSNAVMYSDTTLYLKCEPV